LLELKQFLKSEVFFSFLEKITGLSIIGYNKGESRFLTKQCYTLTQDYDHQVDEMGIDITFSIADYKDDWKLELGGYICYVDHQEKNELITLPPNDNTLSIIFRDLGCERYIKYIASTNPYHYYDIHNTIYVENIVDEDDGNNGNGIIFYEEEIGDDQQVMDDDDEQ